MVDEMNDSLVARFQLPFAIGMIRTKSFRLGMTALILFEREIFLLSQIAETLAQDDRAGRVGQVDDC